MGQLFSSMFLPESRITQIFDSFSGSSTFATVFQTAGIVFVAELGDKSFFIAMVLSSKPESSKFVVFLGCVLALFINAAIATAIGFGFAKALDTVLLHIITGVVFIGFAMKMWWDSRDASEESCEALEEAQESVKDTSRRKSVSTCQLFMTAFITNFISEIGDKTQLAVLTQASKSQAALNVLLGACLGFAAVTSLAVQFGWLLSKVCLTEARILRVGALLFLVFGILSLWEVVEHKEAVDFAQAMKKAVGMGGPVGNAVVKEHLEM